VPKLTPKLTLSAAILALLAAPLLAADLAPGAELGKSEDAVRAALTKAGYDVRKTEMEDGNIEAYVVKDGHKGTLVVSPSTGKLVKSEMK